MIDALIAIVFVAAVWSLVSIRSSRPEAKLGRYDDFNQAYWKPPLPREEEQ